MKHINSDFQWDFKEYSLDCQQSLGVTPLEYWAEILYGGKKIRSHSNIVFRSVAVYFIIGWGFGIPEINKVSVISQGRRATQITFIDALSIPDHNLHDMQGNRV